MKQTCSSVLKNIVAYVDAELHPELSEQISAHLSCCESCSRERDELIAMTKAVREQDTVIEPSGQYDRVFWQKVHGLRQAQGITGLAERIAEVCRVFTRNRAMGLSAAAACCVCIIVFALTLQGGPGDDNIALKVAQDMDLYANMEIIQDEEALEYFEVIQLLDALEQETKG